MRCDALGDVDGLIALTGGASGPLDRVLRPAPTNIAARAAGAAASLVRRPALRRDSAPRLEIGSADEPNCSISPTNAACRWWRPTNPISPRAADHEAQDALLCIADGALVGADDAPPADGRASLQDARGNGQAVRRPARGDRQHRSRSRCAAPIAPRTRKPHPAALSLPGRRRSTRTPNCARGKRGLGALLAAQGCAPGFTEDDYRAAARLRTRRHRPDEISRAIS